MTDPENLYREAIRLFDANHFEESARLLEKAVSLTPRNPDFLEALGIVYGRLNRVDEAVELMKKLAAIDPDHVMAHTNLSQFYARKGMIDEAEHEQAEARRLSWKAELRAKKMSESDIEKISIEETIGQKEAIEKKIEQYKKVIEYDPNDVLGYFTLGSVYLQGKHFEEASQTLEKAVQVGPEHSPSYVVLGEALEALGRKEEALKVYQKGIPVADQKGDIIPLRKMEARVRKLTQASS